MSNEQNDRDNSAIARAHERCKRGVPLGAERVLIAALDSATQRANDAERRYDKLLQDLDLIETALGLPDGEQPSPSLAQSVVDMRIERDALRAARDDARIIIAEAMKHLASAETRADKAEYDLAKALRRADDAERIHALVAYSRLAYSRLDAERLVRERDDAVSKIETLERERDSALQRAEAKDREMRGYRFFNEREFLRNHQTAQVLRRVLGHRVMHGEISLLDVDPKAAIDLLTSLYRTPPTARSEAYASQLEEQGARMVLAAISAKVESMEARGEAWGGTGWWRGCEERGDFDAARICAEARAKTDRDSAWLHAITAELVEAQAGLDALSEAASAAVRSWWKDDSNRGRLHVFYRDELQNVLNDLAKAQEHKARAKVTNDGQ